MFNFLFKIRNQSEPRKKRFLVIITIIVMLFIFWLWNFLSGIIIGPVKYKVDEPKNNSGTKLIIDTFKFFFVDVDKSLGEVKKSF